VTKSAVILTSNGIGGEAKITIMASSFQRPRSSWSIRLFNTLHICIPLVYTSFASIKLNVQNVEKLLTVMTVEHKTRVDSTSHDVGVYGELALRDLA
jgi:hypothetical protein